MKQFLIKFTCLLLLTVLVFTALGTWYDRLSPVSDTMQEAIARMPEPVDLAVVGSSHALYGIKLEEYSDHCFNFSMAGQTPRYDNAMLTEYEDRIADGATVLLTVSYMSPFWTEPESEFLEKQTRYYRFLSPENITDYDPHEAFRIRLNQLLPASRVLYTDFYSLLTTLLDSFDSPAEAPEKAAKTFWYDDIPHQQDVLRKKHQGLITPVFPQWNPHMKAAYDSIFRKAQAHNWKVIAVTTPFTTSYNEIYDPEFYRVFYEHVHAMCEQYGIEYWDYSHDPRFTESHELFSDLDHLSPEGAQLFSQILARRLGLTD